MQMGLGLKIRDLQIPGIAECSTKEFFGGCIIPALHMACPESKFRLQHTSPIIGHFSKNLESFVYIRIGFIEVETLVLLVQHTESSQGTGSQALVLNLASKG